MESDDLRISENRESDRRTAVEREEFNLVAFLRPRIFVDGNHWCVLYGDNLQDGIAGFGNTPYSAVLSFIKAWHVPVREVLKGEG